MSGNSSSSAFGFATQLDGESVYNHGLTKREYFAVMAMQSLIDKQSLCGNIKDYKIIATHATCAADALLAELENNPLKPQQ